MKERPPYQIPTADTEARQQLATDMRAERAAWCHDLLALVPPDDQPAALAAVLELERITTEHLGVLTRDWRRTTQTAYLTGRLHGAADAEDVLGLAAAVPRDTAATILH